MIIDTNKLGEKVGIYSYCYKNKKEYKINENIIFVAASSIKLFLLDLFLEYIIENGISLFDIYNGTFNLVDDSPFFQELDKNQEVSYLDIIKSMIIVSDNTSTNIIIDILGFERIKDYLIKNKFTNTKIQRKMCDFEARKKGIDNYTTPKDIFYFFNKLYDFNKLDIYDKIKDYEYKEINYFNKNITILKILSEQKDVEKIPSGIDLINNLVLNKPGELPFTRNDSGIILSKTKNIFISIFAEKLLNENDSDKIFVEITQKLYKYLAND